MNKNLQKLIELYDNGEFLNTVLTQIEKNNNQVEPLIGALDSGLIRSSQYYWLVENNIVESKQYFYLFGKCIEIETSIYNECSSLELWIRDAVYLLLSDNSGLINKFANLKCSDYEKITKTGSWVACIQAVLRDDWSFLKKQLEINSRKDKSKSALQDLAFFEGIMVGDIKKMEEAINLLATKFHKRRNDEPIINELLSIPAIGYAKLAWLKGYKVQIDNPLVPMEMVKINPNKEYWDYDFMKKDEFKC